MDPARKRKLRLVVKGGGHSYLRLSAAKRRFDPANLFRGHHTVERE